MKWGREGQAGAQETEQDPQEQMAAPVYLHVYKTGTEQESGRFGVLHHRAQQMFDQEDEQGLEVACLTSEQSNK